MKNPIYKFPIVEAFEKGGECAFCNMENTIKDLVLNFVIGGSSYMESNIRDKTNEFGFCREHFNSLLNYKNALGLGLMVHTHMIELNNNISKILSQIDFNQKRTFLKKSSHTKQLIDFLNDYESKCYMCIKEGEIFNEYMNNYFLLYERNNSVVTLTKESKGFCMPHFKELIILGDGLLKKSTYESFLKTIFPIQLDNLKRIEEEVSWLTDKFDYQNKDKSWKNSKDSLERSSQKLSSI